MSCQLLDMKYPDIIFKIFLSRARGIYMVKFFLWFLYYKDVWRDFKIYIESDHSISSN